MICENCFTSVSVAAYIQTKGEKSSLPFHCNTCKNQSSYKLEKFLLKEKIQSIILKIYEHEYVHGLVGSASMMMEKGDNIEMFLPMAKSLSDICADLFDIDYDEERFYNLLEQKHKDDSDYFNEKDDEVWINIGCNWTDEARILLNWQEFSQNVKHKARFFDHSNYSRTNALDTLKPVFLILKREITVSLYRARECSNENALAKIMSDPCLELGRAPVEFAGYNRFSPAGISYIYLANNKGTALKEIRLKDKAKGVIGNFEIKGLELVDLRKKTLESIMKDPFSDNFTAEFFCSIKILKDFISDITKEVREDDKYIDYVPTQILSEYIWSLGYEGFIFDSSLSDGDNYVLFEDDKLNFIDYEILK